MGIRVVRKEFTEPQVRRTVFRLLQENVLCSMSTVTARSLAHINTAYFAYSDDLELFFYSYPDSQHSRNLTKNTSMAVSIFGSAQVWGKPDRGMQLFGTCEEARGRSATKAERTYGARFPGFKQWKGDLKREDGKFNLRAYRFVPNQVKILDEPEFGGGVFVVASKRQH